MSYPYENYRSPTYRLSQKMHSKRRNISHTLLAFLQAEVKIPSTQSLLTLRYPNMREQSSTTMGLILISLCWFSWMFPVVREPCDCRDVPAWLDRLRASTRVWIQLLFPLPGGPATITPTIGHEENYSCLECNIFDNSYML